MKKIILSLFMVLAFVLPSEAAVQWWWCDALTGGVSNSLDSIPEGKISDGAWASVLTEDPISGNTSYYILQFSSGITGNENASTFPFLIQPDTGTTTAGVWVSVNMGSGVSLLASPAYDIAVLSGSTGDISWGVDSSGDSGFHLSKANLLSYSRFYVETSHPGGLTSGATQYTDACPVGAARTGATIYVPELTTELTGREWEFTLSHDGGSGNSPFVLYDSRARFMWFGYSGTTPCPDPGTLSGVTTIPDSIGAMVKIQAYAPSLTSAVSYYFVRRIEAQ